MPKIPMMDIAFAISARGTNNNENFEKMKSLVKQIIDKYSQGKVRYGVILFGRNPSVKLRLTDIFISDDELKMSIDTLSMSGDDAAALENVLLESKRMLVGSGRPGAKKILVLIMDKRSTSKLDSVRMSAKNLENSGVIIIPVAFGQEADLDEMSNVTSDLSNIIQANESSVVKTLADTVIAKAVIGEFCSRKLVIAF